MTTPQEPDGPRQPQQPHIPPPPPLSESELQGAAHPGGHALPVPKEVRVSFWIWIAGAVLSVVGSLYALTQRDEIADVLRRQPNASELSPEQFDAAVTTSVLFAVVLGVVFAGLYVLFAFKARAGRNWARVVLTVLTALGLLSTLFGASVSGLFTSLISVVAVVLLYLPNSKAYFDAVKRAG
ncbi:hypothetical protein [Saccharothrix australiensis]|uniref:Uncharacterized protein n=1 Tax=Saccharothrix australiensis TaxID=2072 RepID=A0A495WDP7_9PSEU|nr:hypothetical protein [Saccharothrix australiensis]RKT57898.1 hypothetical protein C8E97_6630 [Saccharothrix australiensis]